MGLNKKFKELSKKIQDRIWKNKINKGFDTKNVPLEFCYLNEEVSEAFEAWRKKKEDLGEELADVAIHLYGVAEKVGIDLGEEIIKKMKKNENRKYKTVNGVKLKEEEVSDN